MIENPAAQPTVKQHKAIKSAAMIATGLFRSLSIKRHSPKNRKREQGVILQQKTPHMAHCQIYRERGAGSTPTIILGGFVPDATETVEFQRKLLSKHGSIYFINYPRNGFNMEMFTAQLSDLIEELGRKGQKPIILSVSFGAGLLIDYLKNVNETIHQYIRAIILASPVICTDDLVRPSDARQGGVRFLESSVKKLIATNPENSSEVDKQIERSRRCFQSLFSSGAENRVLSVRHLSIRKKIYDVINNTSAKGGFERMMALKGFRFPTADKSIFAGPVLTLLAENEIDTLVPSSPTLKLFRDHQRYSELFPNCVVKTVRSNNPEDGVPHASLIFHHEFYNSIIDSWYERMLYPRLQLAV